ncbi:class I SAM-dependent methyltransferase [Nocardiopsis mangrovi]|uniref:Class I SAM-dependent methyltransferase n=1 Tax=Nocardiopsis mangrovi TaxID=1179818 RepID=A0ABV9E6D6_9ACTN
MHSPDDPAGPPAFEALVADGEAAVFEGWDFGVFGDRLREAAGSWDYRDVVHGLLPGADALLDMGTGGGELLSGLSPRPGDTCATESYEPNVAVARARLEPLGIAVSAIGDDSRLPFPDARFDLVINRHESFDAREVRRILRPGGVFVTQQVGGRDLAGLNEALGAPPHDYAAWDLAAAAGEVEAAGLRVLDRREELIPAAFSDVGALVWFLRITPWQVPGFTVEGYRDRLLGLHARMASGTPLEVRAHRFLVVAERG